MIVRRWWLDNDGKPHTEEVRAVPGGRVLVNPAGDFEIEDPVQTNVTIVSVVAPACGPDAIADDLCSVWTAPLPEGVTLIDKATFQATRDARRADHEAAVAEFVQAQADERTARQAALAAWLAGDTLDDAQKALLVGGL